ncbi:MAG: RtcB family protein [Thermomicrobiales bacterium]
MHTVLEFPDAQAVVHSWLPEREIEPGAMEQIITAARHPEVGPVMAVMPDCHVGYGVTIGSVFPTVNTVLPNAVGVDIGCGMCALPTGIQFDPERMDRGFWRAWGGQVSRDVPTGFSWHKQQQELGDLERTLRAGPLQHLVRDRAAVQLGTLSGGNHFLEAQVDQDGQIWLMVHSGSRATGLKIAGFHNELAFANSSARGLAAGRDLASLPLNDELGQDYLHDMTWATDFALASRKQMMSSLLQALHRLLPSVDHTAGESLTGMINIHHNFANLEVHGDAELMVHRKGATSARDGEIGIIPGSMGSSSFIVRGRGNEASLQSCSHGAGRRMGRKQAKQRISEAEFVASLAGTFSKASKSYIDEAPGAYKSIDEVVGRQLDLIEVLHVLRPLMTVKGDSGAKED